jgi:plastocyanin
MQKRLTTFLFLLTSTILFSQTTHDVTVQNFSFSPQTLTITTGDVVRWTNISGTHNVRANDDSFYFGPAAPAPWEFTHTFTTTGDFPYYCEPHLSMGMTGTIIVQNPAGVGDEEMLADQFELEQNYPNPFNPSTKIKFTIPSVIASRAKQSQLISLKVYNVLGKEIATLVNEELSTGEHEVTFNASEYPSGIYFYQLKAGNLIETKKMILLK